MSLFQNHFGHVIAQNAPCLCVVLASLACTPNLNSIVCFTYAGDKQAIPLPCELI